MRFFFFEGAAGPGGRKDVTTCKHGESFDRRPPSVTKHNGGSRRSTNPKIGREKWGRTQTDPRWSKINRRSSLRGLSSSSTSEHNLKRNTERVSAFSELAGVGPPPLVLIFLTRDHPRVTSGSILEATNFLSLDGQDAHCFCPGLFRSSPFPLSGSPNQDAGKSKLSDGLVTGVKCSLPNRSFSSCKQSSARFLLDCVSVRTRRSRLTRL